jgi:hypothetical protein
MGRHELPWWLVQLVPDVWYNTAGRQDCAVYRIGALISSMRSLGFPMTVGRRANRRLGKRETWWAWSRPGRRILLHVQAAYCLTISLSWYVHLRWWYSFWPHGDGDD